MNDLCLQLTDSQTGEVFWKVTVGPPELMEDIEVNVLWKKPKMRQCYEGLLQSVMDKR